MRSLLFVPADSKRKIEKGLASPADVVIFDLEDSIAASGKEDARELAAQYISARTPGAPGPTVYVRINPLGSGLADVDLDVIVPARPDGIMLPKAEGGPDIMLLSAMLAAREAQASIDDGAIRIVAIATETPAALFDLGSYAGASNRLAALTWGAEDLSAALGAETNRDEQGHFTDPYRLARTLTLAGANAAGVEAIDTVYPAFRDAEGFEKEAEAARRDGFGGKLAIHPDQVAIINRVFTPSPEAIGRARAIVAAFAESTETGVIGIDGQMLDRPHLLRAERVLARARAAGIA
jgi:citrate lyase subunit beta/citryl-CoA lyase